MAAKILRGLFILPFLPLCIVSIIQFNKITGHVSLFLTSVDRHPRNAMLLAQYQLIRKPLPSDAIHAMNRLPEDKTVEVSKNEESLDIII